MKKTIEDLTETKTYYRNQKDAFGNRVREPYEAEIKRKINLVTGWARFGHYLIDALIIGVGFGAVAFLIPELNYYGRMTFLQINQYEYSVSFAQYFVLVGYYFICELTMQRTVGKIATNSVVINKYAEQPESTQLIGRSFARLVPFEAFSCLGDRGWHDKWSETYVVTTKERDALRRLLNEQEGVFISDSEDLLD